MNPTSFWARQITDDEEGVCAVCKKPTKNRCMACKTIYYCNADHQKSHWKLEHKKNCGLVELVEHPRIGRHYIAKRKIEPGEIIFREKKPLVTFINGITYPLCMNCYANLTEKKHRVCGKCKWWLLCTKCPQHGGECEFTAKYGKYKELPDKGESDKNKWETQHLLIGVIRVLALRENNPKAYAKFMKHEDHCQKMKALHGDALDTDVAKLVKQFFKVDDIDLTEMAKINRILLISGFGFREECSYFAEKTSYFEHNCRPNCSKTIPDKNGSFLVWAVEPINAGEHVSLSYNIEILGTMKRKEWLSTTKFFDCTCSRCQDPTEFGTMFNAIKCIVQTCKGVMLPPKFEQTDGRYPDFACRNCTAILPATLIYNMESEIGNELSEIRPDSVDGYRFFIENYRKTLPENHFLMIDAKLKLAEIVGFNDSTTQTAMSLVPTSLLVERIQLSEQVDEVLRALMPGSTRARGRLYYGMAIAFAEKCKRDLADTEIILGSMNKWRNALIVTCKMMCYEAEDSEEGQMVKQAFNQYEDY